jgi:hypothetical protein
MHSLPLPLDAEVTRNLLYSFENLTISQNGKIKMAPLNLYRKNAIFKLPLF